MCGAANLLAFMVPSHMYMLPMPWLITFKLCANKKSDGLHPLQPTGCFVDEISKK